MAEGKLSSREKIVKSALSLFSRQGITATTTKEIAENAGVNEVTLFRQFGSKQGLLLSVLQEAPLLSAMQAALSDISGANEPVSAYGSAGLELLGRVPELVRSLIGESGDSPLENRQALGQALRQANQQTVGYLQGAQVKVPDLPVDAIASLLNTLLVGYSVLEASSGGASIWPGQSDFLSAVNRLFSARSAVDAAVSTAGDGTAQLVADLSAEVVRSLFQKAKKTSPQAHALAYVLFGAGLRVEECAGLMRSHVFASKTQHLLTLTGSFPRQVPVNRWIMGYRYGTYAKNPLTQWLKTRQDERPEVFLSEAGDPLTVKDIDSLWRTFAEDVPPSASQPTGQSATPFQARQTWCIELLMKGMSLENLSILAGLSLESLAAYAQRAKEKAALEQALAIDQKGG
ncbi:MAG: TetR family transcriptional regulator [Cyanobacteria bacterium J06554_11]